MPSWLLGSRMENNYTSKETKVDVFQVNCILPLFYCLEGAQQKIETTERQLVRWQVLPIIKMTKRQRGHVL